jgi:hypothetical protein
VSTTWILEFPERPWTTNAERKGNKWDRHRLVKQWRGGFYWLAKNAEIPPLHWAQFTIEPYQHGGRLQDTGAQHPAVKAAIDGLVDAKVLVDDSPEYVRYIKYLPTQRGKNSLVLIVEGEPR